MSQSIQKEALKMNKAILKAIVIYIQDSNIQNEDFVKLVSPLLEIDLKIKKVKDPNRIKKPLTEYNIYFQNNFASYKNKNPLLPSTEILKLIAVQWKKDKNSNLNEDVKIEKENKEEKKLKDLLNKELKELQDLSNIKENNIDLSINQIENYIPLQKNNKELTPSELKEIQGYRFFNKYGKYFDYNVSKEIGNKDYQTVTQFYPTPSKTVDELISLSKINISNAIILEPSAGDGSIVRGLIKYGANTNNIYACEKVVDFYNSDVELLGSNNCFNEDFLTMNIETFKGLGINLIIATPPFVQEKPLNRHLWASHMLKMIKIVEDIKGKVVCLTPRVNLESKWMTEDSKKVLEYVNNYGWMKELDKNYFKGSGTEMFTRIMCVDFGK